MVKDDHSVRSDRRCWEGMPNGDNEPGTPRISRGMVEFKRLVMVKEISIGSR